MPDGRGATRVFYTCLRPQDEEAVLPVLIMCSLMTVANCMELVMTTRSAAIGQKI